MLIAAPCCRSSRRPSSTLPCPQTYRIAGSGFAGSIFFGTYRLPVTYSPGRDWKCSFSTVNSVVLHLAGDDRLQVRPLRQRIEPSISSSCRRYSPRFAFQSSSVLISARQLLLQLRRLHRKYSATILSPREVSSLGFSFAGGCWAEANEPPSKIKQTITIGREKAAGMAVLSRRGLVAMVRCPARKSN